MGHKFKAPSGLECEVGCLNGGHQEDMTKGGASNMDAKLTAVLMDVIISYGGKTKLTEDDMKHMLAADRKKILFELRQYSLDFEEKFIFTYKFLDGEGEKAELEQEVDISEGLPETPCYKQWDSFDDMITDKDVYITLPKSGDEVRFTMLDGYAAARASLLKKKDLSVNSSIALRNPRYTHKSDIEGKPLWIELDLRKMAIKDIEYLRTEIKNHEGRLDTELMFENPVEGEKDVVVDMLGQLAFFFPSEAI